MRVRTVSNVSFSAISVENCTVVSKKRSAVRRMWASAYLA